MPIYILTSGKLLLKTETYVEDSRKGDPVVAVQLALHLEKFFGKSIFQEQTAYLENSAYASYPSLNKVNRRQRFHATLNLLPLGDGQLLPGSSSSSLGYAMALSANWWRYELEKESYYHYPVFATGQISPAGSVIKIAKIKEKITNLLAFVKAENIEMFYFCYPKENNAEITLIQRQMLEEAGAILCCADYLPQLLENLIKGFPPPPPHDFCSLFKGLESYRYKDSFYFFGQEKTVNQLFDVLEKNKGVLIVSGASGTGKSSLLEAGLIPKVESEYGVGNIYWQCTTANKTLNLTRFVFKAIIKAWQLSNQQIDLNSLNHYYKKSTEQLVQYLKGALQVSSNRKSCVLFIDQCETLFYQSYKSPQDIARELQLFEQLTIHLPCLKIILALRSEYLGNLLKHQALHFPVIFQTSALLDVQSWREIVKDQSHFFGIEFELNPDTDDTFDKEIIQQAIVLPYALPMVSLLLKQLCEKAQQEPLHSRKFKIKHYNEIGGVKGVIAYRANQILSDLNVSEQQCHALFETLVGINKDGLPYAHIISPVVIQKNTEISSVINAFRSANIIVGVGDQKVKLIHDSLFEHWQLLKDWLKQTESYLYWRYKIEPYYLAWLNEIDSKKKKKYLLKDKRLRKKGIAYLKNSQINDPQFKEYIKQSKNRSTVNIIVFVFTTVLIISLASGFVYDRYWRIKSEYYANFGTRFSIPFGVGKLDSEQIAHRQGSYRMDYQGGQLKQIRYENSAGTAISGSSHNNASIWQFHYTENNELDEIEVRSKTNQRLRIEEYDFYRKEEQITYAIIKFKTLSGDIDYLQAARSIKSSIAVNKIKEKTSISRSKLVYNSEGLLIKREYQDPYGYAISDNRGVFAKAYQYNNLFLLKAEQDLSEKGTVLSQELQRHLDYNRQGEVMREKFIDINKKIISTQELERDLWGNVTEITNNNLKGHETPRLSLKYDSNGNNTEIQFKDKNGKLTLNKSGYARRVLKYNPQGRIIEETYFGLQGQSIINPYQGFSKITLTYDLWGNIKKEAYWGLNNKPVLNNKGYASVTYQYNQQGNMLKVNVFGITNEPVLTKEGFSGVTRKYDSQGKITEEKYLGIDENLVLNKQGFAKLKKTYYKGNLSTEAYYDVNNKSILNNKGYHLFSLKYNQHNQLIEETYKGVKGQPVINEKGYSLAQAEYNTQGKAKVERYFGIDGKLILNNKGIASIQFKYDRYQNEIEQAFLGAEDEPVLSYEGISKIVREYDQQKNIIVEAYFSTNGKPVLCASGYTRVEMIYNQYNQRINTIFYNIDGEKFLR